jgi:hypothetical protein
MEQDKNQPDARGISRLTDWEIEPDIRSLKQDLENARPAHQSQMSNITRWSDLMAVRGSAKPKKASGRSSVQPKLIRRQAEWRYAALTEPFLGTNKLFKVSPVTFEDGPASVQNELVLNWQFRTKMNRVQFVDNFVRATVDEGTSITRVGWKRVTVPITEMAPTYEFLPIQDESQIEVFQAAMDLRGQNPREYEEVVPKEVKAAIDLYLETEQVTYAVQVGEEEVQTEKVLINQPVVDLLDPQNVIIDPSCNGDLSKALFVIVSFETNKAELLKEPERYKNLDAVNWEGNAPLAQPDHSTSTPDSYQFSDSLRKKVVAYEYWGFQDINGDGTLTPIVATWIGDVPIRMEENPFPDGKLPFVLVPYLPVKRNLYGEPDAELLEDNQKILGAVTRGMIDLLGRSANSQQGIAKGMLDALNRRRYENGEDYEFNPNVHPQQGVIEHKYPELPQSGLLMLNLQNQEAEALTGVKSFGGGISGEAYGDVAAGIRGVLDAASKREMAILRRLAKGMTEIGNKIIAMNGVFLSEVEIIRITNKEFIEVKREDLIGNFDLETDISTAEVDDAKAKDLAFMLQTIGPNHDPSVVMMILAEIADLKRMPELAEKLRRWAPKPSPEQIRLQELAIEKAELENEKLRSEIMVNDAKAKLTLAEKDIKDLDYVEQETGTKHAREMEKQKGQAKGNQDLQITKALTAPRKEGESAPDISAAVGFNQLSDTLEEQGGLPSNVEPGVPSAPQPVIN